MSLRETCQYFRQVYQVAHQPLPHEEEYQRFADDALQACSEWFGPPRDSRRPFFLCISPEEVSACTFGFGQYVIYLAPALDTPQERCESISHEIYHRVTMRRHGLRREPWIDEIMAFLASQWFLNRHGYDAYACENWGRYIVSEKPVDVAMLRRFRLRQPLINTAGRLRLFPENFYPDVKRLATALYWVVNTDDLRRLPWAESLSAWVDSLPDERRGFVCRLLELPGNDGRGLDTAQWCVNKGNALQALGRFDEAVVEFRSAQGENTDQDDLLFDIALCLERAGHYEEARDTYLEAAQHDAQDEWIAYNLALIYQKQKDYSNALIWFQQALERKPDWPHALYYLGMFYAKNDQQEQAYDCWRRIVELNDAEYAHWAKVALIDAEVRTVLQGESHEDDPCA